MKFQNCILITLATDARTHGQTESNMPLNFSKVGGIKNKVISCRMMHKLIKIHHVVQEL